jgi:YD repeat-containing protein
VRSAYDAANRLASVADRIAAYTVTYTYNDDNTIASARHSSGALSAYTYDAGGRVTRIDNRDATGRTLSSFAYVYDAAGNPTQVTRSGPGAPLAITYSYDALNRLTREDHPRYSVQYTYDAAGNRTRLTAPQGAITYTYDAANQMLSAGSASFAYDADGNQVTRAGARGAYTLTYNDAGRLAQITAPGGVTTTFRYDPLGRRIESSSAAGARRFIYDGWSLILEGPEGSTPDTAYLWGANALAASRSAAGGVLAYAGDSLGNVANLLDGSGSGRGASSQDPFGDGLTATGAGTPLHLGGLIGVRA